MSPNVIQKQGFFKHLIRPKWTNKIWNQMSNMPYKAMHNVTSPTKLMQPHPQPKYHVQHIHCRCKHKSNMEIGVTL
eukprot:9412021-Ditylum_brightwellii.AAC.1